MDTKKHIADLLTTIETLSAYAGESCLKWEPEEDGNFTCEAFFHVINIVATEAKGWVQTAETTSKEV